MLGPLESQSLEGDQRVHWMHGCGEEGNRGVSSLREGEEPRGAKGGSPGNKGHDAMRGVGRRAERRRSCTGRPH